jgi:hypothetical protein
MWYFCSVENKNKYEIPLSMDKYSRNERLYPKLLEMGLFVEPRFETDDRKKIDCFIVSTGLPEKN